MDNLPSIGLSGWFGTKLPSLIDFHLHPPAPFEYSCNLSTPLIVG